MPDLAVIILTYNEERHIARALKSLEGLAREIFVIALAQMLASEKHHERGQLHNWIQIFRR